MVAHRTESCPSERSRKSAHSSYYHGLRDNQQNTASETNAVRRTDVCRPHRAQPYKRSRPELLGFLEVLPWYCSDPWAQITSELAEQPPKQAPSPEANQRAKPSR